MGLGRFKDGKFDLVVVANFPMTQTDVTEWRRSFEKASELFWDASEGQIQYGRIFVCDDSIGLDVAEMILHESGDPSYGTFGEFGSPGKALHLMPYVKFQVLTQVHEMGHHVWALGDEYSGPQIPEDIDTAVVPPDNKTIPLVGSAFGNNALAGASAILSFGSTLERRFITGNSSTEVTVSPAFSQSPIDDDDGIVRYQFAATCAPAGNNFCIMEHSRGDAGELDEDGTWTPAANPVTEYCTDSNHDPDGDTEQEVRNHDSCWEFLLERSGFEDLSVPDPATPGPASGSDALEWIVLEKQSRFSVVIDRSGSMAEDNKMADAQHGAVYWLEYCAVGTDLLSIVAYDDQIEATLAQTEVSALGGVDPQTAAINALTPRGKTDIRDALFGARDQIESLPTRAAVQVVLLLTDGVHNSPSGSSALEAIPDLQEGGIRVYALGVGSEGEVDEPTLIGLASHTGGRAWMIGDGDSSAIENLMVEINAEVRGGIITTLPLFFPDSAPGGFDEGIPGVAGPLPLAARPDLKTLLEAAGLTLDDLPALYPGSNLSSDRVVAVPVDVEERADRASFTVTYPETVDVWLYLVDPTGAVVDTSPGAPATLVTSTAPHEFIVVKHPIPGRWTLVAVRPRPGTKFVGHVCAGGENRNLQAFASAPPISPSGSSVPISASARWGHELTGLRVTARVVSPSGARQTVVLTDATVNGGGSGSYQGIYTPNEDGRYEAIVTIRGPKTASMANPHTQLAHVEGDSMDFALVVPQFVRQVVVHFIVGDPPPVRQRPERPSRRGLGRRRPAKLVSAERVWRAN